MSGFGALVILVAARIYLASQQWGGNFISGDTSDVLRNRTSGASRVGAKDRVQQRLFSRYQHFKAQ
jgi:hypothetical protein